MSKYQTYTQVAVAEPVVDYDEQHVTIGKTTVSPDNDHDDNRKPPPFLDQPAPPIVIGRNPKYVDLKGIRDPVMLTYCPRCTKQNITTRTKDKATSATWVGALVGFVVFWPLAIVPFCVKGMKETEHHCPNCGEKVGKVEAFK